MDVNTAKAAPVAAVKTSKPTSTTPQHTLPPLPYDHSALEPCIDAATMALHHDKHHAGYVDKLNVALEPYPDLRRRSAPWLLLNKDAVPHAIRTTVQQNAGGHLNHSLFWRSMARPGGAAPTGSIAAALNRAFGSLEQFKTRFDEAGEHLFGSGWVWLVSGRGTSLRQSKLDIVTTSGHDNPIQIGRNPLLVSDVWEHAYYLQYQNRRPEYLKNRWSIVDWTEVARRFEHPDEATDIEPADGLLVDAIR